MEMRTKKRLDGTANIRLRNRQEFGYQIGESNRGNSDQVTWQSYCEMGAWRGERARLVELLSCRIPVYVCYVRSQGRVAVQQKVEQAVQIVSLLDRIIIVGVNDVEVMGL